MKFSITKRSSKKSIVNLVKSVLLMKFIFQFRDFRYGGVSYFPVDFPEGTEYLHGFGFFQFDDGKKILVCELSREGMYIGDTWMPMSLIPLYVRYPESEFDRIGFVDDAIVI